MGRQPHEADVKTIHFRQVSRHAAERLLEVPCQNTVGREDFTIAMFFLSEEFFSGQGPIGAQYAVEAADGPNRLPSYANHALGFNVGEGA